MDPIEGLSQLLTGKQNRPSGIQTGAQSGFVVDVVAEGAIVRLPKFSNDQRFGPMPYMDTATAAPQPGDRCLVMFVGSGIDEPWLIAWTGA